MTIKQRRAERGWLRFLIYFLMPVPIGVLGFTVIAALLVGSSSGLRTLPMFFVGGVCKGYQVMGLQSAAFALLMVWLERRRMDRGEQCLVAVVFGCLAGGSMRLWSEGGLVFFVAFGGVAGPGAMLVADLLVGYRQSGADDVPPGDAGCAVERQVDKADDTDDTGHAARRS